MKRLSIFILIPVFILFSCAEEDAAFSIDTQPELPPSSSMAPDFSAFNEDNGRLANVNNWAYAASNVGIYSAILYTNLAVPVTAFQLAINQEPTFNFETGLWIWSYDVSLATGNYNVELTANVSGITVDWIGYISLSESFDRFIWFEGESNLAADSGSWILYEGPESVSKWISVEWNRNIDNGTATSFFTIEKEGTFQNSSITYSIDASATFDRSVIIVDTNNSNTINTDWNSISSEGRVKSELWFNDSLFHCWDENLMDIDCPE